MRFKGALTLPELVLPVSDISKSIHVQNGPTTKRTLMSQDRGFGIVMAEIDDPGKAKQGPER